MGSIFASALAFREHPTGVPFTLRASAFSLMDTSGRNDGVGWGGRGIKGHPGAVHVLRELAG